MQLNLTDRMQAIADLIENDETVADIGTDHGYIPIWLLLNKKCAGVILADVNEGPLERAAANAKRYLGHDTKLDMRLGSGIEVLDEGEVDTVIIAGMGGILMRDILAFDIKKTLSLKKLILQPRNNSAELRGWMAALLPEFTIINELVVKEGKKFSEILCAVRNEYLNEYDTMRASSARQKQAELAIPDELAMEIPCMYLVEPNETTGEYLSKRLSTESDILNAIMQKGRNDAAAAQLSLVKERIKHIKKMTEAYNEYRKNTGSGQ